MKTTQCTTCLEYFSTVTTLMRHERSVHRQILPVVCPVCSKSFRDNYCYAKHYPTHTEIKRESDSNPINPALEIKEEADVEPVRKWKPAVCECYVCDQTVQKREYRTHMRKHTEDLRRNKEELRQIVQAYCTTFEKISATVASYLSQL